MLGTYPGLKEKRSRRSPAVHAAVCPRPKMPSHCSGFFESHLKCILSNTKVAVSKKALIWSPLFLCLMFDTPQVPSQCSPLKRRIARSACRSALATFPPRVPSPPCHHTDRPHPQSLLHQSMPPGESRALPLPLNHHRKELFPAQLSTAPTPQKMFSLSSLSDSPRWTTRSWE